MEEFTFSENFLQERKRDLLILSPYLALASFGFGLFWAGYQVKEALTVWVVVFSAAIAIFAIVWPISSRSLRNMKVLVHEDKIVKQSGRQHQVALWRTIKRIKRVENVGGRLLSLTLYQEATEPIYLFGFEGMEAIDLLIRGKTSPDVPIQTTRHRLNWEAPSVAALEGTGALVLLALVVSRGAHSLVIFVRLASFGVGAGLLIFRPLRRGNLRSTWYETILGVLSLMVASVGSLTWFLLSILFVSTLAILRRGLR